MLQAFKGLRGLAQGFVSHFATEKVGANEGLRLLREQGLGYRRTDYLADYRFYSGVARKADALKYLPLKYCVGRDNFSEPFGARMKSRYAYKVRTEVLTSWGEVETGYGVVRSETNLTAGDILGRVSDSYIGEESEYEDTLLNVTLSEAWHREGDPWD
jgi:hypothetical protein